MRRAIWGLVGAMLCAAASAGGESIEDLAFLAGCWASEQGEAGSGEQWMAPAGGTMLGMSRTVRGGATVAWEFLQIREVEPGKLAYVARPSGQAEASFALVRVAAGEAVFENPQHDFPQRIVYRREGEERLLARVEGPQGEAWRGIDFPLRRVACGAPAGHS